VNNIRAEVTHAVMTVHSKSLGITKEVLIDLEDVPKIDELKWYLHRNFTVKENKPSAFYIIANTYKNGKPWSVQLHRYIMSSDGLGHKTHTQHINHNTMDNRQINLKVSSAYENLQHKKSRQAKGCTFMKKANCWNCQMTYSGRTYSLGRFKTESQATAYYDIFRQARLKNPDDSLPWEEFKTQTLREHNAKAGNNPVTYSIDELLRLAS
jgi:hypothetical protein